MHFTHDTEVALVSVVALVNTAADGRDALTTPAALSEFLDEHSFSGRRDLSDAELEDVRALRTRLHRLWSTEDPEALVVEVNDLLRSTGARPRLVRHDGWDWHLHVTDPQAPLADRMGAEAAMALVDVVRGDDLHRLRTCATRGCSAVLVDLSRNSSRRYCDTGCANRTHVAAHRARRRATAQG